MTFRETLRDASPEAWATEKWSYDAAGNMTAYFDPKTVAASAGATQTVTYDSGAYNTFPQSIANALGHTNQEIAKELYISTRTTEMHRASIMRKLRFDTRAQLVNYALANGLIGAT